MRQATFDVAAVMNGGDPMLQPFYLYMLEYQSNDLITMCQCRRTLCYFNYHCLRILWQQAVFRNCISYGLWAFICMILCRMSTIV